MNNILWRLISPFLYAWIFWPTKHNFPFYYKGEYYFHLSNFKHYNLTNDEEFESKFRSNYMYMYKLDLRSFGYILHHFSPINPYSRVKLESGRSPYKRCCFYKT